MLSGALPGLPGCGCSSPDRLVVATTWPAARRHRLESEFQKWIEASHDHLGHRRVRVEWVALSPGDDLVKLALRARPPQVLLGGGGSAFALLSQMDQLSPIENAGSARWCTVGQNEIDARADGAPRPERPALSDPRVDPAALHSAMGQLSQGGWRNGYALLVRTAASGQRFKRAARATIVPILGQGAGPDGDPGAAEPGASRSSVAGVAIVRSPPNQELAQGFLRFLVETEGARAAASPSPSNAPDDPGPLIADLLGATLVDAQDELWTAWRALEGMTDREQALAWLTEPPPWPPASVAKYLGREGERAMSLIETLATEVAPEAPARAWLLRSWLAPGRPVDELLLAELTQAAEGRLYREPRFRAWLREEWTAWARQRYRRVARFAAAQGRRAANPRTTALP